MNIRNLLLETRACCTAAETRRLLHQGGIKLDGVKVTDPDFLIPDGTHVLSVGLQRHITVDVKNGMLHNHDSWGVTHND